jgi:putative ABC transport system ATP-binding protein
MEARTQQPVVQLAHARYRWPRALEDCLHIEHLEVGAGERVFLRGPSGSGKSTLLSLVAGIVLPTSGTARFMGRDWSGLSGARRDGVRADHIGYVFQQFNLLPYLSVLDNALLACRFSALRAQRAGDARREAGRLLERAGLEPALWGRKATELSVGQQQRVAAVRALLGRPELVVAGEPTSALDEELREAFMGLLAEACAEAGSALLFVSHDARLAGSFDRIVDMSALRAPAEEGR